MSGAIRRFCLILIGVLAVPLAITPSHGQEDLLRRLLVTEGADYAGYDYQTLREIDQSVCEAACLEDNRCRAFTYNVAATWCFLKSDFGALTLTDNAIAGRVLVGQQLSESIERQRQDELLAFLAPDYIDEARRFVVRLETTFSPGVRSHNELQRAAANARSEGNPELAANLYGAALALANEDTKTWLEFGRATILRQGSDFSERNEIRTRATSAAINAYLRTDNDGVRAAALVLLGSALELRQVWRPAIKAYRASLELSPDPKVQAALDQLVAEHGFRILCQEVDVASESPRICVVFSDPLPVAQPGLADFVTVGGGGLAIEPEGNQICVDGVTFGNRYRIQIRAGLPALDGGCCRTPHCSMYLFTIGRLGPDSPQRLPPALRVQRQPFRSSRSTPASSKRKSTGSAIAASHSRYARRSSSASLNPIVPRRSPRVRANLSGPAPLRLTSRKTRW